MTNMVTAFSKMNKSIELRVNSYFLMIATREDIFDFLHL